MGNRSRHPSRRVVLGATAAAGGVLAAGAAVQSVTEGSRPLKVAFLIDDLANVIDLAGPWEVFQDATHFEADGFSLYTVADAQRVYRTTGTSLGGLAIMPHYTFDNAPEPDIVTMGAQAKGENQEAKLAWIRKAAERAQVVMSVCTGAFLLARTGLLDGKRATTHHLYVEDFRKRFPNVQTVPTRRFVDNGKFVTAGGLTSGIDAALHVVAKLKGEALARQVADYMEHASDGWRTGA